ncbi:MAG TPA: hypothetical protein VNJ29_01000 [Candidatus Nitrosotenuis sp.]|nr:hypothetical protein [Candidatus Nitrosotenuis sp.]
MKRTISKLLVTTIALSIDSSVRYTGLRSIGLVFSIARSADSISSLVDALEIIFSEILLR